MLDGGFEHLPPTIRKIVSGGQTGVDRAALDYAISRSIPHGGWIPSGRRAEDGAIPGRYELRETPSAEYAERTEWNVRDSDATLIITVGPLAGGSLATLEMTRKHAKPVLHIDGAGLSPEEAAASAREWLAHIRPDVLNIAGPRASEASGAYDVAVELLTRIFALDRLARRTASMG